MPIAGVLEQTASKEHIAPTSQMNRVDLQCNSCFYISALTQEVL